MRIFPGTQMRPSGKRYASKGCTYRLERGGEKRAARYLVRRLLYKVHLTETCDDDLPHPIIHAETTPATTADR